MSVCLSGCVSQSEIRVLFPGNASTNLIKKLCISVFAAVGLLVSTVTDTHTWDLEMHTQRLNFTTAMERKLLLKLMKASPLLQSAGSMLHW